MQSNNQIKQIKIMFKKICIFLVCKQTPTEKKSNFKKKTICRFIQEHACSKKLSSLEVVFNTFNTRGQWWLKQKSQADTLGLKTSEKSNIYNIKVLQIDTGDIKKKVCSLSWNKTKTRKALWCWLTTMTNPEYETIQLQQDVSSEWRWLFVMT